MVTSNGSVGNNGAKNRRKCIFSKDDFLPEESFKSWRNYAKSWSQIGTRLKDRLLSRSLDSLELHEMRARSEHEMTKSLNWWDLIWFGIGSVMGAGIFVLTGEATRNHAGPAVIISYLISGVAAMLSVLCYSEFAVELPVAGGSFAYLRVELGDFVAYIAAGNILFEYIIAGAGVARSWTSYFASLCNHDPNSFRIYAPSLAENYNYLDPIAVVVSILTCIVACWSIKGSSRFNSIATIAHLMVLAFVFVAGLTKANPENYVPFAPFGFRGILKGSALLFFAYIGFDGVATLAEEIKKPARDIPIGLIGSMSIVVMVYCLLSGTLSFMQAYNEIDVNAPFTLAFQAVGMNWAKYIVAVGALKGMTTVLLMNIIGQARYFTHIGRTHMAPPILAAVNEKTGTPVNATVIMTVANSLVAFFTSLDVLSSLLSISTLFIFSLVALGLLIRRYYVTGETTNNDRTKLVMFLVLIVGSSLGNAVYWALTKKGWMGHAVMVPVWFLSTLGLQLTLKQARKPKLWGVPFLPWLPSASIAVNVFIMGSIDKASFIRFVIWTCMLLLYYLFVALHASYDAAIETQRKVDEASNLEAERTKQ